MFNNKEELIKEFGTPYGQYGIKTLRTNYLYVDKEHEDRPFEIYFVLLNEIINDKNNEKPLFELSLRKTVVELDIDEIFNFEETEVESLIQPTDNMYYDIATKIFDNKTDALSNLNDLDGTDSIKKLFIKYNYEN